MKDDYIQEEDDGLLEIIEQQRKEEIHVDPPEGWRYDFPKIWDKNKYPDLNEWLVQEGYPKKKIEEYGDVFYCRFWTK
jgi:hypothetical protein